MECFFALSFADIGPYCIDFSCTENSGSSGQRWKGEYVLWAVCFLLIISFSKEILYLEQTKNCPYFNTERLKIHRYHNSRTHSSFLIYIMAFFLIAQLAFPFLLQGRFCHAYILVLLEFSFILAGRMLYSMNYEKV